ncbi:MAG: endo-1,4-beta-xylanase [Bacteroidetes bacterium]|nr:endo-1,4-beta-xylanase [Bacteroidota bacterium]
MPLVCLACVACGKYGAPAQPVETLKSVAPFPVGAAVNPYLLKTNSLYYAVVATEYNSVTTENVLKFNATEPQLNQFDFSGGDTVLSFAAKNHMRVHAHNLVWHQALPGWVLNFSGDSLAWENIFKTHIQSVVAHCKGKVSSWDVVNEAIRDDDGKLRNKDVNPGDGSIWRQHLGPDYIARAFQYAHEADPGALLFYNDYGQEWNGVKLDSMVAMVNRLKRRGIPIDGIGMQMHIGINTNQANMKIAMQRLASTGLLIHISELDVSVNPSGDTNIVYNDALQSRQADMYQLVAQTYISTVPKAQRYGITTWNVGDADSWIPHFYHRKDWPLPFDSLYRKKAAYEGYLRGLKN